MGKRTTFTQLNKILKFSLSIICSMYFIQKLFLY